MDGAVVALIIILALCGLLSLALIGGLTRAANSSPFVVPTLAFGVLAAVALLFYAVALGVAASATTLGLVAYIFLVSFTIALVLGAVLPAQSSRVRANIRDSKRAILKTIFLVLLVALVGLVMYWEGSTLLGFITPLVLVATAEGIVAVSQRDVNHRKSTTLLYLLLLLSALLLALGILFCLDTVSRPNAWLWGPSLVIYSGVASHYVRYVDIN